MDYRVLIIGGGIGGLYTALNLIERGLNPKELAIVADEWPPYSKHRLASVLMHNVASDAALIKSWIKLSEGNGVKVFRGRALSIDPGSHEVSVKVMDGDTLTLSYGKLVVASGGVPRIPSIEGIGVKGVVTFHRLKDVEYLKSVPVGSHAVVIGGGLVGLAAAVALRRLGHNVTVIEVKESLLPSLIEPEASSLVRKYVEEFEGVNVILNTTVEKVIGTSRVEGVKLSDGRRLSADVVVISAGVRPNSSILREAGAEMLGDAVMVDQSSRTSLPDVYALGDCAVSKDLITGKTVYRPLGFVAAHYARVTAESIIRESPINDRGVLPVIYERIGELRLYRIGLSLTEASYLGIRAEARAGVNSKYVAEVEVIDPSSGKIIGWEHVHVGHERLKSTVKYLEDILGELKN